MQGFRYLGHERPLLKGIQYKPFSKSCQSYQTVTWITQWISKAFVWICFTKRQYMTRGFSLWQFMPEGFDTYVLVDIYVNWFRNICYDIVKKHWKLWPTVEQAFIYLWTNMQIRILFNSLGRQIYSPFDISEIITLISKFSLSMQWINDWLWCMKYAFTDALNIFYY